MMTTHTQAILDIANIAYASGDGRLNESLTAEQRGDSLAQFIVNELRNVTEDVTDERVALEEAARAIVAARREIEAVEHALQFALKAYA